MVSVVMGFRDWLVDHLALSVRAHLSCSLGDDVEVIVVDYGSSDPTTIRNTVEGVGGRVVRVQPTGRWNRAAALNIGIRQAAKGDHIITTDADILFAPKTIETVLRAAKSRETKKGVYALVQCRDLPPDLPVGRLQDLAWDVMKSSSSLRPTWGMGGCACFPRRFIEEVRGYDERLEWWGGEDNDLCRRAERYGLDILWVDDPDALIYHMWHERALDVNRDDPEFKRVWARNREIAKTGHPIYRNPDAWGGQPSSPPPVSVVIITRNRAPLLREAIASILTQTFENFELVIVDDGSDDDTRQVVAAFDDPRIRYIHQQAAGIPRARNVSIREARGEFICTMDDDDLMLPNRIESHIRALDERAAGSYGGWIDHRHQTGELAYCPGRPRTLATLLFGGKTMLHPASMIRRSVMLQFPYDEQYAFGSDYDMNLRLAAAGHRLNHTGDYLILRRIHGGNVTVTDGALQREVGRDTRERICARLSEEEQVRMRDEAASTRSFNIPRIPDAHSLMKLFPGFVATTPAPKKNRLAAVVERIAPLGARVIVVSRGDDSLLEFGGRTGCHFPQTKEGTYAGYHPRSSEEAIDHLEQLRGKGAEFLVFPASAFWWLAYYDAFRLHLNSRYRLAWKDGESMIYDLGHKNRPSKAGGDLQAQWSAEGKAAMVLRVLAGETASAVSKDGQIPVHELEHWRQVFLKMGTDGLRRLASAESHQRGSPRAAPAPGHTNATHRTSSHRVVRTQRSSQQQQATPSRPNGR